MKKGDKENINRLEFAAKAAEEFLKTFNQVKAAEPVKPLSPYMIKKKETEEWKQGIAIDVKRLNQRRRERDEKRIRETMAAENLPWIEAALFISKKRSDNLKQRLKENKEKSGKEKKIVAMKKDKLIEIVNQLPPEFDLEEFIKILMPGKKLKK